MSESFILMFQGVSDHFAALGWRVLCVEILQSACMPFHVLYMHS